MGGNSVCASVCALTDFLIAVQLVHVCRSCPSTSLARLRFIRISGHTIGQEVGYLVSIPFADLVLSVHCGWQIIRLARCIVKAATLLYQSNSPF